MDKEKILYEFKKTMGIADEGEALKELQKVMHEYKALKIRHEEAGRNLSQTLLDNKRIKHEIELITGMRKSGVLSKYTEDEYNNIVKDVAAGVKNLDDVTSQAFSLPKVERINPKFSDHPVNRPAIGMLGM